MRAGRFAIALALAVLVHAVGVRLHPQFGQAVDLFLVLTVLFALAGDSRAALLGGLAAGTAHDALAGGLFGIFGFADTIVGYGVARLSQRLVIERPSGVLPVAAVASVVQQAVAVGLALSLLPDPRLPDPIWLAIRAAVSGVLGMLLFGLGRWWRGGADRRRRRRREKIQLG
jgi:rod shape-determining protein MreD